MLVKIMVLVEAPSECVPDEMAATLLENFPLDRVEVLECKARLADYGGAGTDLKVDNEGFDLEEEEEEESDSTSEKKPRLQLSGEDGNAFFIMGRASATAKKAGWSKEKINEYLEEAKQGDYDHLLQVTMKYFDTY